MDLFKVSINLGTYGLEVYISWIIAVALLLLSIVVLIIRRFFKSGIHSFEIDEAEIGVGNQRIRLRPNYSDLQVAFQFWAELSTRKIGIPIDHEHDLIIEVYSSWYEFFRSSREMLKSIPASQVKRKEATQEIVHILVKILNEEMRPHLTQWQACYRQWWDTACKNPDYSSLSPLELQKQFPQYQELMDELIQINKKLVVYKETLGKMIFQ